MKINVLFCILLFILLYGCNKNNSDNIDRKRPLLGMDYNSRMNVLKEKIVDLTCNSELFIYNEFLDIYENPELFIDTVKYKLKHLNDNAKLYHESNDIWFYYATTIYSMYRAPLSNYIDLCYVVLDEYKQQNIPDFCIYLLFTPIGKRNILYENRYDIRVILLGKYISNIKGLDDKLKKRIREIIN